MGDAERYWTTSRARVKEFQRKFEEYMANRKGELLGRIREEKA